MSNDTRILSTRKIHPISYEEMAAVVGSQIAAAVLELSVRAEQEKADVDWTTLTVGTGLSSSGGLYIDTVVDCSVRKDRPS
jgi:hypothetical protein